jgi:hypothetical protein
MISDEVYGPFLFAEKAINGIIYLGILAILLVAKLLEENPVVAFQHDCTPRRGLYTQLSDRYTGRGCPVSWPPSSPDVTPSALTHAKKE